MLGGEGQRAPAGSPMKFHGAVCKSAIYLFSLLGRFLTKRSSIFGFLLLPTCWHLSLLSSRRHLPLRSCSRPSLSKFASLYLQPVRTLTHPYLHLIPAHSSSSIRICHPPILFFRRNVIFAICQFSFSAWSMSSVLLCLQTCSTTTIPLEYHALSTLLCEMHYTYVCVYIYLRVCLCVCVCSPPRVRQALLSPAHRGRH